MVFAPCISTLVLPRLTESVVLVVKDAVLRKGDINRRLRITPIPQLAGQVPRIGVNGLPEATLSWLGNDVVIFYI